jgi:DNA processing protein
MTGMFTQASAELRPADGRASEEQRLARAVLTYLAEPGDAALGALLEICEPTEVVAAIKADRLPAIIDRRTGPATAQRATVIRAMRRWRLRLPDLPSDIAATCGNGIRLVCPTDPEWPRQLDELGLARPYALWLRGPVDLRSASERSVSMVGSRAASGYGAHVAAEIAADLAERCWTIVSGGAYGIDAAVHRGVLATGGTTMAVLACGVDRAYPVGHADLFAAIAADGLVISEWPPGSHPTRLRFLIRNRVIAALTTGTVIVEAGERSGALNTARHAAELQRPLMAVPGPVTSAQSAGCHRIIRELGGVLVTSAEDVMDLLGPLGDAMSGERATRPASGPARCEAESAAVPLSRDDLDLDSARVLDAFPARGAIGPSTIARKAGVELDTVIRCLGLLVGCGFVERGEQGWRLTRKAR